MHVWIRKEVLFLKHLKIKSYLTKIKIRFSILKSPHVNKRAKEHYHLIFYSVKILIQIYQNQMKFLNILFLNKLKCIHSKISVRKIV